MSELQKEIEATSVKLVQDTLDGRYEVGELIGSGGMGSVYRGKHIALGKSVAIKIMRPDKADAVNAARFELEAKSASQLAHENVVRVHDYGTSADGTSFVAMDYVEGPTLASLLTEKRSLHPAEALPLFIGIARGLEAAHKAGIVHRDIKPSNVLLGTVDGVMMPKIGDFGVAKVMDRASQDSGRLTQTGEIIGSPYYMSPEQCLGFPVDRRSDIYAFGCLMYETLLGETPFQGENAMQVLVQHINADRGPLSIKLKLAQVPDALANVIMHALDENKDRRYQSVNELLVDLESCAQGKGLARRHRRKRTAGTGTIVAVTVAVCAVLGIGLSSGMAFLDSFMIPNKEVKTTKGKTLFAERTRSDVQLVEDTYEATKDLPDKMLYADFSGMQLQGLKLDGAWLPFASFNSADVSKAVFRNCNVADADFRGANCQEMEAVGSSLGKAEFVKADLTKAKLTETVMGNYADFSGANLTGTDFTRTHFIACVFKNTNLKDAILTGCDFGSCSMSGLDLSNTDLHTCKMSSVYLMGAN